MSLRITGAVLAIALLFSGAAHAQKVVVLEFEGDRGGRLHNQLEGALKRSTKLNVLSSKKYKELAEKKKFKGARAMTAGAIAALARPFKIDIAVEGAVTDTFFVRLLDPDGKELWQKDLKLKSGVLTPDNVRRLAKVIVTAANTPPGEAPEKPAPAEVASAPAEESRPSKPAAEEKAPSEEARPEEIATSEIKTPVRSTTAEERDRRAQEDLAESHTAVQPEATVRDEDLDVEATRTKAPRVGPRIITFNLNGGTTWRSYCSRPGVNSCREYDSLGAERPPGDTVDFSAQVPYAGFGIAAEVFPLAVLDNLLEGIGFAGGYSRGFSLTNVKVVTPSGQTPEKPVISVDETINVAGVYRYFFSFGDKRQPMVGYVGLRGGWAIKNFSVDRNAEVPLPGSHRTAVALGLDVSVPLITRYLRIEASGTYYINPRAGVTERAAYGDTVASRGFTAEGGLAGDVWGPLGWTLRFRFSSFGDRFTGRGDKWETGGSAQETYLGVFLGPAAYF